jgi:hypothetical protein
MFEPNQVFNQFLTRIFFDVDQQIGKLRVFMVRLRDGSA